MDDPGPNDDLDALLARVLAVEDSQWGTALDSVCDTNPELASALRRRFGYLQRLGLAPVETRRRRPEPQEGQRLADYDLEDVLGAGAMGVVFRAIDRRDGVPVALKVLRPELLDSLAAARRLRREGQTLTKLTHPQLCRVREVGEADGVPFLAMELMVGETLEERLRRARKLGTSAFEWRGAAACVEKVARGLACAHAAGVVHRDVKPANVLLRTSGEPVLFDFGLAWSCEAGRLTHSGAVLGTPAYMAPEQVRGQEAVAPPADVWALGAVLYECLSLRPPFPAAHRDQLYRRILNDDPEPLRRQNRELPRALDWIVQRCLEKRPDRRYPDAGVLADDLAHAVAGRPTLARAPSLARIADRLLRRHPVTAILATAGVVLVVVLGRLVQAERHAATVADRVLASAVQELSGGDPVFAALLAREAFEQAPSWRTRTQLVATLRLMHQVDEVETDEDVGWAEASPDGKTLLCAVMRSGAGRPMRTTLASTAATWARVLQQPGYCGAWSHDGRRYAVGLGMGVPQVFDAETGAVLLRPVDGPLAGVQLYRSWPRLAFDHEGTLWWGDAFGNVHAARTDGPTGPRELHPGEKVAALFRLGPESAVLTVGAEGSVTLCQDGEPPRSLARLGARVVGVALSGDRRWLAVCLEDRRLLRIPVEGTGDTVPVTLDAPSTCVDIDHTGSRMLAGTRNQALVLWAGPDAMPSVHRTTSIPEACAFAPPTESDPVGPFAASYADGQLRVFDSAGLVTHVLRGHRDSVRHLEFTADGAELLSCGSDHTVRRWRLAVPGFPVLRGKNRAVFAARWLGSRYIVAAAAPGVLGIWDPAAGRLVEMHPLRATDPTATVGRIAIAVAPKPGDDDCHWIAAGAEWEDLQLFACRPRAKRVFEAMPVPEPARRRTLSIAADRGSLSMAGKDRSLVSFLMGQDGALHVQENAVGAQPLALAVGGDGSVFLSDYGGTVTRWSPASAPPVAIPVESRVHCLVPLDDGRILAGHLDGAVRLMRRDGDLERSWPLHGSRVEGLDVSPDGKLFVTAGADGIARVLTIGGDPIVDLPHGGIVYAAHFSPDGRTVLTAGSDRTVRVWPITDDKLLRLAHTLIFRGLTAGEAARAAHLFRR